MMFKNNLKIGIRSILNKKIYSFINAIGLSIAMSFCILIYLFIKDENGFDKWHAQKDRIVRLHKNVLLDQPDEDGNLLRKGTIMPMPMAATLKSEVPEVEYATPFSSFKNSALVSYEDKVLTESVTYIYQDFFKMFDFKSIRGDYEGFLANKDEAVLTESTAKKFFGEENPIGESIVLTVNNIPVTLIIIGVLQDAPANSSIVYEGVLVRMENKYYYEKNMSSSWNINNTNVLVALKDASLIDQFSNSLDDLHVRFYQTPTKKYYEARDMIFENKSSYGYTLLTDIHLDNSINWSRVSSSQYSFILGGIALLILVIAAINYISLAVARARSKGKEIGVRKTIGSSRAQLVNLFMIESVLLAIIAMAFSWVLISLTLPLFNDFTGKVIALEQGLFYLVFISLVFAILMGIFTGIYPSLYLSSFKPLDVLKSNGLSKINIVFTRPLVVLQFVISAFLLICSVTMWKQMNFIINKDLGYNPEQIIVIPTHTKYGEEGGKVINRFRNATTSNVNILNIAGTTSGITDGSGGFNSTTDSDGFTVYSFEVDDQYIKTLNISLEQGRNFDSKRKSDYENTIIVNEALVKGMGWQDPLNEVFKGNKIIGVVKNYHFRSLENNIEPAYMHMGNVMMMLVKISSNNIPHTLEYLGNQWKELVSDKPFDYSFLDEKVAVQYESYLKWKNIMTLTTALAIFIACLGLFGLAGINSLNRIKEIGIRKVLGAELSNILVLLNKQYVWLAIIAFVIASPLSWYVMDIWLNDFEFAIRISWEIFVVSMLLGLFVALSTVSYHAIKSAFINPAETLKHE